MPDKMVTLNYILVGVFCKSGKNVWYLFFAQKKKKIAIKLNRKRFNVGGTQQFKNVSSKMINAALGPSWNKCLSY